MDKFNNNEDEQDSNTDEDIIIKSLNNLKAMCYEINNIDNMARTKIVLIDDEIKWLKKIINNLPKLDHYL